MYPIHRMVIPCALTANKYIRKRRLTSAAQELQTSNISVIEATYKYDYESLEGFSKTFSRFHGSTLKEICMVCATDRLCANR